MIHWEKVCVKKYLVFECGGRVLVQVDDAPQFRDYVTGVVTHSWE